ncbi:MAG: hypothetical protein RML93_07725 [Anaerolineales bacterium]|nr:hypothetical protein [Anaerolineales bacterium]MDW8447162.1 hypothetical protein [Anaerolineales bacterium]
MKATERAERIRRVILARGFYHHLRYNACVLNSVAKIFHFAVAVAGVFIALYGMSRYRNPQVVIEWETATEVDTVGFNLYRAAQPEGPYQKLNPSIIPSSSAALEGGSYHYIDANVMPGRVYYYQLEDIDDQGRTTLHPPIPAEVKVQGLVEIVTGAAILALGLTLGIRGWLGGNGER